MVQLKGEFIWEEVDNSKEKDMKYNYNLYVLL